MASGGEDFTVDIEQLRRGGVDITHLAEIANAVRSGLSSACDAYEPTDLDGEIGEAIKKNYQPGAKDCLRFLDTLGLALETGGQQLDDVSGIYERADVDATDEAKRDGRK